MKFGLFGLRRVERSETQHANHPNTDFLLFALLATRNWSAKMLSRFTNSFTMIDEKTEPMIIVPERAVWFSRFGWTRDAELSYIRARLENRPFGYFRDDPFPDSTFEASILKIEVIVNMRESEEKTAAQGGHFVCRSKRISRQKLKAE